jgi:hypothetical protein
LDNVLPQARRVCIDDFSHDMRDFVGSTLPSRMPFDICAAVSAKTLQFGWISR